MFARMKKVAMALAALAALAFGGAQIAQGAGGSAAKPTPAPKAESTANDTDQVQSGDQSTPDKADAPDKAGAAETPDAAEPAGSETPGNDGPGGHADEPSNPNANHEATGAE